MSRTHNKSALGQRLQNMADGKLICATHFVYREYVSQRDDNEHAVKYNWEYEWRKKPWDDHHKQGKEDDPALEDHTLLNDIT